MNKQEFILGLTKLFLTETYSGSEDLANGFNNGIIKAIELAHDLDEPQPAETKMSLYFATNGIMRKHMTQFSVLTETEVDDIAYLLTHQNKLSAIKMYKDATNLGLKEAKEELTWSGTK